MQTYSSSVDPSWYELWDTVLKSTGDGDDIPSLAICKSCIDVLLAPLTNGEEIDGGEGSCRYETRAGYCPRVLISRSPELLKE